MTRKALLFLVMLPMVAVGCSSIPLDAKKALEEKGVLDVLKKASEDKYEPPADGRLTAKQIEMYLAVRKREAELAKAAAEKLREGGKKLEEAKEQGSISAALEGLKAVGNLGDLATADVRAAQELGHNTAEYVWVKGKILEVSTKAYVEKGRSQLQSTLAAQLERMKEARDKAQTEEQKKLYSEQIEAYEKAFATPQTDSEEDPALQYNRELLAQYEDLLAAVESEIKKYGLLAGDEN